MTGKSLPAQTSRAWTRPVNPSVGKSTCISIGAPFRLNMPTAFEPSASVRAQISSGPRSEEHTSELQSLRHLVWRLLLSKKQRGLRRLGSHVVHDQDGRVGGLLYSV